MIFATAAVGSLFYMHAVFFDPADTAPALQQQLLSHGTWQLVPDAASWPDASVVLCMAAPDAAMWALAPQALWLLNDVAADIAVPDYLSAFRFCGWPGFTARSVWEVAACTSRSHASQLAPLSALLGVQLRLVANVPGLVAPRVLACIISEACYGLAEGICTAADMDTAMQLGTNYPQGPVAWGRQIGAAAINHLLQRMAATDSRYTPHPQLTTLLAP